MLHQDLQHINTTVDQNIRAARQEASVTQSALADACGTSFQQVQKYETGQNRVSAGRLLLIARALGVPVEALFAGAVQ